MILRVRLLEIVFALFLAVAMVRIVPFSSRTIFDPADLDPADGLAKQITLAVLFGAIALVTVRNVRLAEVTLPLPFLILMSFAALSLTWSAAPLVGARRLALTLLVSVAILAVTAQLRPKVTLDLLRRVTVALAFATLSAGLLYPRAAIHQPGDAESAIVGAWRGIFYHKNHAGAAIGLGVVLAADALLRDRRLLSLAVLALTALTLFLTRSKTAEIGAALAMVVLLACHGAMLLRGRNSHEAALMRAAMLVGGLAVLVSVWFATDLRYYVLDPAAFTGRGQLWAVVGTAIERRPLIGYGYESVFQAGEGGIMAQLSNLHWIRFAPHSHNGVLDLLVTTGVVGLLLYGWALFVAPWNAIARLPEQVRDAWQPTIAALLCYAFVQSLMEGKSFSGDSTQWIVLVLVLGLSLRLATIMRLDAATRGAPDAAYG